MKILVLQHIEIEPPALIGEILSEDGFELEFCHGYLGEVIPQNMEVYDGLLVMGGPMGVYEDGRYCFLRKEMKLIESALNLQKPVLGVCLGSQLLAHVLGSKVYPGSKKEIGWHPVELYPEASKDPLWKDEPDSFMGFHWHGDVFDLPRGAEALAKSGMTAYQAYRYGSNAYGILFHMEVSFEMIRQWAARFNQELFDAKIDGQAILQKSPGLLTPLQKTGRTVFSRWSRLAKNQKPLFQN